MKFNYLRFFILAITIFLSKYSVSATYYSLGSSQFSVLANWNTIPGGGGANPVSADLTNGTNTFVIQNTHNIVVDQDISVAALIVGSGVSGSLSIGNAAIARNITVAGNLSVNTGANINVGSFNAVHTLTVSGNISNAGTINMVNTAVTRVCNTILNGASFPQILGTATPTFNDLTISAGPSGADITRAISVFGNFLLNNNTPLTTAQSSTITGSFTVTNGSTFTASAGTTTFNNATTQTVDVNNATFIAMTFSGSGTKNILGSITATGLVTIGVGVTLTDAGAAHVFSAGLTISNAAVLNLSGTVSFAGNLTTGNDYAIGSTTNMGTASWTFTNTVNTLLTGGATAGQYSFAGDLTINAGATTLNNNTSFVSSGTSFSLNGTSLLVIAGLTKPAGITNFPTAFSTYTIAPASTVRYNMAGNQIVSAGSDIVYGNLQLTNNTKTVSGSPLIMNGTLTLNTVTADLSGVDVTLGGSITAAAGTCALSNNQTFTLDGNNVNQTIGAGATYNFNNLVIAQSNIPTASRTKTIATSITVDGDFTTSNTGGSNILINIIDLQSFTLLDGSPSGTFNLGSNVQLNVNGTTASEFQTSLNNFTTILLDATFGNQSRVRFNNAVAGTTQIIPYQNTTGSFSYGNIELAGSGGAGNTKQAGGSLDINGNLSYAGGTVVFNDGNFNHTIAGDWLLWSTIYTAPGATCTITFDGSGPQYIGFNAAYYQFRNIVIANTSGLFSINFSASYTLTILGDLTINSGANLDASNRNIAIAGNWIQLGTGIFTQTATTTFNGTTANQTISIATPSTSYYGNFIITKTAGVAPQTVTALTNMNVNGNFTFTTNQATFDATNVTVKVVGNWNFAAATTFISTGSTIDFSGNGTQTITNAATTPTFNNIQFSGTGTKTFSNNAILVNGNMDITGANVAWSGATTLTLMGNWLNTGGTGTFIPSTGTVLFNGAAQNIGAAPFYNLTTSGTGGSTKTLTANVVLNNALVIGANTILDVSPGNYTLNVGGNWTNSGTFSCGTGTVNLTGGNATIVSGTATGPATGFNFYNLTINKTASANTAIFGAGSDMVVLNNFIISVGTLALQTSADAYVAGNFTNNDVFTVNNIACQLNFTAASGTKTFDPGISATNSYRNIILNATGATYQLANNLLLSNAGVLTISGGTFLLNGKTVSLTGAVAGTTVVALGAGTLYVDAGATLKLSDQTVITINNASSVFKVVGTSTNYAVVTTNSTGATGYTINQSNGVFHAKYYTFSNLRTTGITLSGSTIIDPVNNFSNGTFTSPASTGLTQYIDVSGIALGTLTPFYTVFGAGTAGSKNVKANGGTTGYIEFADPSGALQGAANETDDGVAATGKVRWAYNGYFWTDAGNDGDWFNVLNWNVGAVPTATDNAYIDHTIKAGAFSNPVTVNTSGAVCNNLTINAGGATAITLSLTASGVLTANGNVSVFVNNILTFTGAGIFNVKGSFSYTGAASAPTAGTVAMTGASGSNVISSGNYQFYNLTVNATGAIYTLGTALVVNNDVIISNGSLDVSGANFAINAKGNWTVNGGGVFNPQAGTVTLSKSGISTQTISGGNFYNLTLDNATAATTAIKSITSNCIVLGSVIIGGTGVSQLTTSTYDLYIAGSWTNNSTTGLSSNSTVYFNGTTGTQTIAGTQATIFNHLTLSGAALKNINFNEQVNGDLQLSSTSGIVTLAATAVITDGGGANTLTIAGATTFVVLATFPTVFETISLSPTSIVRYQSNGAQTVYSVVSPGYGTLQLYAATAGTASTKTALGDLFLQTGITMGNGGFDNNVTLNMNNFNMNLAGANFVQQTGAPQVNWGTGTMTQSGGTWSIDADITGFNNWVLGGTGVKLMQGNLNLITGNVTVQNGATLSMQTFTLTCIGASKTLALQSGGTLTSALTASIAFPTGFATNTLDPASTVTLNGAGNQTAQCTNVTYGILNFTTTVAANVSLNANLVCAGDFSMNNNTTLVDGGFNMNFSGANIDIRTYTPTLSTSTITLSGAAQTFCNASNGANFTVGNVIFGGTASSVKTLGARTSVANTVYLSGTIVINSTIVVNCARNLFYTGASWTNNGNYNHNGGLYTFSGAALQTINPGVTNTYNSIAVSNTNNPGVLITTNGMNITTTTVINANARFDMGGSAAPVASITHTFGGAVTNNGYWTTANAHLIFNGGTAAIPVNDAVTPLTTFTARNVTIGAGTKTLAATTTWQVDNLTINAGTAFNPGAAANVLNVKGDWTCNGTFTHNNNTVNFNGNGGTNASAVSITAGNSAFFLVNYAPTGSAVSYTLQSTTTTIQSDMTLGNLATLNLNAKILILGRSAIAVKTYTINGVLNADANSTLSFDNRGSATAGASQCVMTVTGGSAKLKLLGSSSAAVATLTAVTGGTQASGYSTAITITSGAEIQARYYMIQYLADAGMVVTSTAVINNTNNFSDGSWAYMNTTGTGAANRYYLDCEAPAPAGTIANVAFNYNVTPVPANRFNVKRTTAATTLQFVDVISGTLGSFLYESDDLSAATGRITWPPTTTANWIGAISSNFNDGLNWSSGATPNANTDCIIGAVINNNVSPVIDVTSGAAVCKLLTITNGRLDISGGVAGIDLDVKGSISIGTTGAGILNVSNADVTIQVGGSWTRGAIAGTSFINGNGTISFNATSGSFTIDPKTTGNYAFGNIVFNGATSSYTATGGLTATGNFTINDATFIPTSGITVNIGGDYTNTNGVYTATPINTSTTVLTKSGAQLMANATFYNLTVSGSGVKTFSGNASIYNNVTVNTGTTLRAPGGVDVLTISSSNNGNMTISSGGIFDDNGGAHYFNGAIWTATTASYAGSGTITFNRTSAQSLTGGQFNNLNLTTAGNVTVAANVIVNANIDVNLSLGGILILNNNFSITGGSLGVFTLGSGQQLNVNGTNNCPSGFLAYAFDPTSTTNYTQLFNQVIGPITYGNLFLNTATVKTLAGDIVVLGTLTINNSTLDVSSNNYDVSVAGNFNNNGTGSFLSNGLNHAGELIINGSGTQNIFIGSTGSKSIYNLTINKTVGSTVNVQTTNISILNNLTVQSGIFSLNNFTGNIGGDMTVTSSNGAISQSGTFNMIAATGSHIIQLNGSNLNNVIINASGITYTAQDNISVYGNFTLTAGTFDGNGKYVNLGNIGGRTISVAAGATYKIGAGGTLALGNTAAVTVNGTLEVIGSISSIATVTKTTTGGSYNFDVNGTLKAQYYLFEYMTAAGISINASATIDPTYNLSDGTFTNGPANCKYLTFSNTQTLTISNVIFPFTPTGSANNVVKSTAGVVTFYNATGTFAGASFESDDGSASTGAIRWTGAETLTWIGAVSTDWYVAGNWSSSLGGNGIPDATKNAIIATNVPKRNPTIDGSGGSAQCKNLTINSTMILTLNTPAGISDLIVNGDVQINGEIKTTTSNDYIEVTGNWVKITAGTVNLTNGTVTFKGTGSKTINNGTGTFKNLTINNAGGSYLLGANTIVNGDLSITAGSLDVSGSFYSLTVKGNWVNSGTFISRTGSTAVVTLSSTTAGAVILNPGTSSFNILTINGGASTVYTLTTNNLSTAGNCNITSSELKLNGLVFNLGDNIGSDALSIYGTLNVNANATLKMGAAAVLAVYSGGTVKIVGTSGNIATVTKQTGGSTYAFSVSSGGTIHAQYYLFEYMNVGGIVVNAGATINTTNNFSNGTFSNGFANGKYLVLLNNFANYTATGVTFNSGPAYSCSRINGTGEITFFDPSGPLASYIYEEDDNSPTTGLVLWTYSNPQLTWIGVTSTDWQDPTNWSTTGPPGPPDNTTDVTIFSGTPFQPVLTANAATSDFTMASGSTVTMEAFALNVKGKFSNNGGTFTSTGTVTLSALTGTNTVDPGTSSFYNLTIASPIGYFSSRALNVTNDFTINGGSSFTIANAAHTLTIGNNWTSNGATFTHGSGTVVFNKNSGTCSLTTGTAGAGGAKFYNLSVIQAIASPVSTKTQTLTGNLTVAGTLLVSSTKCLFSFGTGNTVNLTGTLSFGNGATLMGGSSTINVYGNWLNNIGAPFSYGTSTVVLKGGSAQTITRSTATGEAFYNLTVTNASGITCAKPVVVYGQLTLTNGLIATTASNILTMAAGSTTSLGTASSYVNGPMIYTVATNGATSINFPIGKSTSWRPVVLNVTHNSIASATYTAEMLNTSAKGLGYTLPGTIANVSSIRYWQIDRAGAANLSGATATLYYKTTGVSDVVTDPTNLRVAKTVGVGTAWTDVGGIGSVSGTGSITTGTFTQFCKFTIANATGGTNPLPVELVSFNATRGKFHVNLDWITMTETNNDYFTVEKSTDGVTFEMVTKVIGAGNSTSERDYTAIDDKPVSGLNYYRLKQTDYDGEFVYSKIIMVNSDDPGLVLIVYPNPAINNEIKVSVSGNEGEPVNVVLRDILGKAYYNETITLGTGYNQVRINRDNSIPAGIYFVVATSTNKVFTERIIVQ